MTENNKQDTPSLGTTALHGLHLELGAKMVPFAGYAMPVQYPAGILSEHLHTRQKAGLFDVSHMGQIKLHGEDAALALETLVPMDIVGLGALRQRYALFTNAAGGVLDDLMVVNAQSHLLLVVNAACKHQDLAHLCSHLQQRCEIEPDFDRALLALQGPAAVSVLAATAPGIEKLGFMRATEIEIAGAPCFVTRSGYTGEDGFEISVQCEAAEELARALLAHEDVEPVGLGARDSLRLEAGLCLYGHELDPETTPVEASLNWALSKARRADGARAGGYPGAEIIEQQRINGPPRHRVGIAPEGRAPIRDGAQLTAPDGRTVGRVTSGGFSPSLGRPVAIGMVETGFEAVTTPLQAVVRGKARPVEVASLPFVPHGYHRS